MIVKNVRVGSRIKVQSIKYPELGFLPAIYLGDKYNPFYGFTRVKLLKDYSEMQLSNYGRINSDGKREIYVHSDQECYLLSDVDNFGFLLTLAALGAGVNFFAKNSLLKKSYSEKSNQC